jgi:hypothetical protein
VTNLRRRPDDLLSVGFNNFVNRSATILLRLGPAGMRAAFARWNLNRCGLQMDLP